MVQIADIGQLIVWSGLAAVMLEKHTDEAKEWYKQNHKGKELAASEIEMFLLEARLTSLKLQATWAAIEQEIAIHQAEMERQQLPSPKKEDLS